MNGDVCQLCGAVGPDKRHLNISCLYELTEVVPEMWRTIEDGLYHLRICKSCRARLLDHLESWREECVARKRVLKDPDGNSVLQNPEAVIPVRMHGTTVMMTPEQHEDYRRNT